MSSQHSTLSRTYAQALLELAEENDRIEQIANDVDGLKSVLEETPAFTDFLRDPGIGVDERQQVIHNAFSGKVDHLLENFLQLLNVRGRIGVLPQMLDAFETLLDEKLGKVEVDVTVAEKLGEDELAEVGRRVSEVLGKEAVVHQYVDPQIIGGVVLRVGDQIMDASVRRQLEAMRQRLLRGAYDRGAQPSGS